MAKPSRTLRNIHPRTRALGLFLLGLGLLVLGAATFLALADSPTAKGKENPSAIPAAVSRAAPELILEDLSGNSVSLEGLRGQVVLVNNWATWCPPCRAEMPTLEAFYRANRGRGFTLVAIDAGDPVSEVEQFVQSLGLTFPIWLDPNSQALAGFNTTALPSSFVIDREGTVRLAWTGAINREMLDQYVIPLLAE